MLRTLRLFILAFVQVLVARARRGPLRPSWPFGFEMVCRYLRLDWDETAGWPGARIRADMAARPYPRKYVKKVRVEDSTLGGVSVVTFVPPEKKSDGAVLFFHGGSYVYGSAKNSHADLGARLALVSGASVVAVEYRLAPEHRYPAQLEDALTAFDALVASGTAASEIVLAGDSAGGNLAIATQLALRDRGGPQAKALALLSPWVDLTMPGASFTENERYDFGTRAVLAEQAKQFAGDVALHDRRVSPTYATLAGLSPAIVLVGEAEIPRDDIRAFAKRLREEGVDVTLHEAADMPHNAAFFADYHASAKAAFDALVAFVGAQLSQGATNAECREGRDADTVPTAKIDARFPPTRGRASTH